jgi:hypothetical protein
MPQRDYFETARDLAEKTIAGQRTDVRSRWFRMVKPRKQPTVTVDELMGMDEELGVARLDQEIKQHGPERVARAVGIRQW